MPFTEATYEQAIIELFEQMGYTHLYAPELERDYESPLLDAVKGIRRPPFSSGINDNLAA